MADAATGAPSARPTGLVDETASRIGLRPPGGGFGAARRSASGVPAITIEAEDNAVVPPPVPAPSPEVGQYRNNACLGCCGRLCQRISGTVSRATQASTVSVTDGRYGPGSAAPEQSRAVAGASLKEHASASGVGSQTSVSQAARLGGHGGRLAGNEPRKRSDRFKRSTGWQMCDTCYLPLAFGVLLLLVGLGTGLLAAAYDAHVRREDALAAFGAASAVVAAQYESTWREWSTAHISAAWHAGASFAACGPQLSQTCLEAQRRVAESAQTALSVSAMVIALPVASETTASSAEHLNASTWTAAGFGAITTGRVAVECSSGGTSAIANATSAESQVAWLTVQTGLPITDAVTLAVAAASGAAPGLLPTCEQAASAARAQALLASYTQLQTTASAPDAASAAATAMLQQMAVGVLSSSDTVAATSLSLKQSNSTPSLVALGANLRTLPCTAAAIDAAVQSRTAVLLPPSAGKSEADSDKQLLCVYDAAAALAAGATASNASSSNSSVAPGAPTCSSGVMAEDEGARLTLVVPVAMTPQTLHHVAVTASSVTNGTSAAVNALTPLVEAAAACQHAAASGAPQGGEILTPVQPFAAPNGLQAVVLVQAVGPGLPDLAALTLTATAGAGGVTSTGSSGDATTPSVADHLSKVQVFDATDALYQLRATGAAVTRASLLEQLGATTSADTSRWVFAAAQAATVASANQLPISFEQDSTDAEADTVTAKLWWPLRGSDATDTAASLTLIPVAGSSRTLALLATSPPDVGHDASRAVLIVMSSALAAAALWACTTTLFVCTVRRAAKSLEAAGCELDAESAAREEHERMAALVAHELRNPVSTRAVA